MEKLTLREIEIKLEQGMVGKNIKFLTIQSQQVIGMVQRLSVNIDSGEVMIIFTLGTKEKLIRYEVDIRYFNENTTILYGDNYTEEKETIRSLLSKV